MKTEITNPFIKNLDLRVYTKLVESKTVDDNVKNILINRYLICRKKIWKIERYVI